METSTILVLLLVVGVSVARQLPSERRHFTLKVTEAGETFEETDDLDEDENIEVIHVPAHNGLKEIKFILDHNQHLTMRLVAGSDRCLMSPALTSTRYDDSGEQGADPEQADITASEEAKALSEEQGVGPISVQTEMHTLAIGDKVAGSARARLAPAMLRLCDGRDIYRLEPMDDVMSVETDEEATRGMTLSRVARDETSGELLSPSAMCSTGKLHSRCKLDTTNCGYRYQPNPPGTRMMRYFTCTKNLQVTQQATTADRDAYKRHCSETAYKHYLHQVMCCKKCCNGTSNVGVPICQYFTPTC